MAYQKISREKRTMAVSRQSVGSSMDPYFQNLWSAAQIQNSSPPSILRTVLGRSHFSTVRSRRVKFPGKTAGFRLRRTVRTIRTVVCRLLGAEYFSSPRTYAIPEHQVGLSSGEKRNAEPAKLQSTVRTVRIVRKMKISLGKRGFLTDGIRTVCGRLTVSTVRRRVQTASKQREIENHLGRCPSFGAARLRQ
jgi:hypothetical protein